MGNKSYTYDMELLEILQRTTTNGGTQRRNVQLKEITTSKPKQGIQLIFGPRKFLKASQLQTTLESRYGFPKFLWNDCWYAANGYAGSSRMNIIEEDVDVERSTCWFRFMVKVLEPSPYKWYEMSFFISSDSNGPTTILCFDVPTTMQANLITAFEGIGDIFAPDIAHSMESIILEQVVYVYDDAVWIVRDCIRNIELARTLPNQGEPHFAQLHELARHTIHTSEILHVAVNTAKRLTEKREKRILSQQNHWDDTDDFGNWTLMLENLRHRSDSLKDRLTNEIHLAFNLVAQRDSQATVATSIAARQDSAAMKTISVVTLAFLPATFVSTVFSMSFFNFSIDEQTGTKIWRVSDHFWIYWVIAVPLTIMTILAWKISQRVNKKLEAGHIPLTAAQDRKNEIEYVEF